ncbi:30S ribosomal protein S6 [Candidatus Peregrinibacteria bacterium]|nr:30S ribosomal protein S6 [Candidatus Peregrinibacteria bacterium]
MVLLEDAAEQEARLYEFAILYPSSLSQKEEQGFLHGVTALLEEAGGKPVERDMWGTRGLAYPIRGHREGKFLILHYTIDPARVRDIDQQLRIMKGVLRHLVLTVRSAGPIVKFSARYDLWLKEEETKEQTQKTEKEEHVRRQLAERARRQAQRPQKKAEHAEVKEEQITEQIQKIITDEDIDV